MFLAEIILVIVAIIVRQAVKAFDCLFQRLFRMFRRWGYMRNLSVLYMFR